MGTIGVTAAVNLKNCTAMNQKENQVDSLARLFQLNGKRTGLVTTTRVTHASPAGICYYTIKYRLKKKIKIAAIYAHTAERHWETDTDVMHLHGDIRECEDIAHQLVFRETGQELNVILGRSPCSSEKRHLKIIIQEEDG